MDSRLNKQVGPVCRFGPGGDFVSVWPGEFFVSGRSSPNRVRKLLTSLSELITLLLGLEPDSTSFVPTGVRHLTDRILAEKEKLKYGVRNGKADRRAYTASTAIIESNRQFQSEPMLFTDDWRVGIGVGRKSKHRIRAYRRTAKKKPAFQVQGQGSLFETDFKSARTA